MSYSGYLYQVSAVCLLTGLHFAPIDYAATGRVEQRYSSLIEESRVARPEQ